MTLREYIKKRNGLPLGASGSLKAMLRRSLGASSPRQFWQYWNPIFGYYLGKYVHGHVRKVLPSSLSLLITFVVSGLIHDLVTFAVSGSTSFFFGIWFLFLALGLLAGELFNWDLSKLSLPGRMVVNIAYLSGFFVLSFALVYGF
ncbi:MBOAT family protein [Gracilimonas mengyeensis]|uniref:Membrane bound O-acyl transferase family protein n=1 Tax=Gracilimonas mengyeensis TaxID=1302730 RepID=A0A521B131_9BACT|nr:MBOAT family protein [Gracilimonas mengyeensis]SMO40721.1 Membrane bound O-acyl transferase family protein [Gracilimonas mengyeensis]